MIKKKFAKRIVAFLFATIMCLSLSMSAFAAEVSEKPVVNSRENSDIMPISSISGYARKNITSNDSYIEVSVSSEGTGGMGITIKTTSSSSGSIEFAGFSISGNASQISGSIPINNGEMQFHDLYHNGSVGLYYILFTVPAGVSVDVQVWIYG